jgi:hypothetical protein
MAMRWTFHLPSYAGQPWKEEYLKLTEDGEATWSSEGGEGDVDVDEELTPKGKPRRDPTVECHGHLGPGLHRRLVTAAQQAMAVGCTQKAPRAVDAAATTTIAVTWEGAIKSCTVQRSGGRYVEFEKVRSEVIDRLCHKR